MYVDDAVDAFMFLIENYNSSEIINVGIGSDFSIMEIANIIKNIAGFKGEIVLDKSKPDGMLRKLLDSSKINSLGWKPKISIEESLKKTYEWYKENAK